MASSDSIGILCCRMLRRVWTFMMKHFIIRGCFTSPSLCQCSTAANIPNVSRDLGHVVNLLLIIVPYITSDVAVASCNVVLDLYNPLGNLDSGRSPWAKLIRSASLQRIFDAAIAKLLWRLVSRCFYVAISVFFYDNVELTRMAQNVYRQSPDGDTERFLTIILAVCRILDKLHGFSNILCTCSIFIKMWAQI